MTNYFDRNMKVTLLGYAERVVKQIKEDGNERTLRDLGMEVDLDSLMDSYVHDFLCQNSAPRVYNIVMNEDGASLLWIERTMEEWVNLMKVMTLSKVANVLGINFDPKGD